MTYVNAEDLGGEIHAEAHMEEKEGKWTYIHKFSADFPYRNNFEQRLVMKRAIRSVMEQARYYENQQKKSLLTNNLTDNS